MKKTDRRNFLRTTAITGIGLGFAGNMFKTYGNSSSSNTVKVGIIGLDTSHCVAFTKTLNDPNSGAEFSGYKVVAAYPKGSNDIESSVSRIPAFTEEVKTYGVEIVDSIDTLLSKVDVVLLETNDGRLHLEQALLVLKAGKRMFIDKPIAASLTDAMVIFEASRKYKVPIFSSSSLRYAIGMDEVTSGKIGKVIGADTFSPAELEKTHPDLFWYAIHGVEPLYTAMGTGCKSVVRVSNEDTDVVVGTWADKRIGVLRGIRKGKGDFGGTIFGDKAIKILGGYPGYNPLLAEIIKFFNTGVAPVKEEETLEILAFMEAADISKANGGAPVEIDDVMKRARKEASKIKI